MAMSIAETIAALTDVVGKAEAAKEAGSGARKVRDALNKAAGVIEVGQTVEYDALRYFLDTAVHGLAEQADGFDREAGSAVARRAQGIVMADLVEGSEADNLKGLLDRWSAVSKRSGGGGRRSGESTTPDLGFTVKVKDEATGQTIASTTKKNLNSLRDQVRKHHEKEHGSKPSRGEPTWQGITDALKAVMDNGSQSAQGGGYLVDKAA